MADGDIEIARRYKLRPIDTVAGKLGLESRASDALRPLQGQGAAGCHRPLARASGRQARARHGDDADAGGRRQVDDHRRARRRTQPHRQASRHLPARTEPRTVFRHQGWCDRRRPIAGRADGGHQPPLHGRFPRDHDGEQPARRVDRQPRLLGQRARHRRAPHQLAAGHRHERSRVAQRGLVARWRGQWLSARGWLRHHGRVRSHGDLLSREGSRRSQATSRQHHLRAGTWP